MEITSKAKGGWKKRLIAIGLGILALGIVFGLALLSSGDIRVIYIVGAVALLGGAIWLGASGRRDWIAAGLLVLPLFTVFVFVVLAQIPALWVVPLLWAIAVTIGLFAVERVRERGQHGLIVVIASAVLLGGSLWCCISYFPKLLAEKLNNFTSASAPSFALQPVSSGSAPTTWKPGKILVMDFFATWCVPCKAELPELQATYSDLSRNSDIHFVLVGSDLGGDTPERVQAFAKKQGITIPLAFDPGCRVRNKFGTLGLPSIIVIDRSGQVRLIREGYNPAETTFRRDFLRFLETL
ncbi:MAG: redoxin domain-containing protein [Alphaproteobacteria bacterium]